jgi:hypothetical protein
MCDSAIVKSQSDDDRVAWDANPGSTVKQKHPEKPQRGVMSAGRSFRRPSGERVTCSDRLESHADGFIKPIRITHEGVPAPQK